MQVAGMKDYSSTFHYKVQPNTNKTLGKKHIKCVFNI